MVLFRCLRKIDNSINIIDMTSMQQSMASPLTQAKQATVKEDLKADLKHKCRIVTNLTIASKLDLVKHRKVKQENKTWRPRLSHAKCCPHHLDYVKAETCRRSCHLPSNQDVDTERCKT